MSEFTKGPWTAGEAAWYRGRAKDDTESGKRPITAGDHGVVANVYGRANAHLIAAAPDLYAALSYMAGVYECSCPDECVPDCAMAVARAALAKAEGQ